MKSPPTDHRSAHAARAALEAQRAARMQDTARAEDLENARRLHEAQARPGARGAGQGERRPRTA